MFASLARKPGAATPTKPTNLTPSGAAKPGTPGSKGPGSPPSMTPRGPRPGESLTSPRGRPTTASTPRTPRGSAAAMARQTGQGPFLPTQSHKRALFGLHQAVADIQRALARISPEDAIDAAHADRALLSGMGTLLRASKRIEENARANLDRLKDKSSCAVLERTAAHNDPRLGLREQLSRTAEVARSAHAMLEVHSDRLFAHVELLRGRLSELDELNTIICRAIDDGASHGLTSTAASSLSSTSRPGSAPTSSAALRAAAGTAAAGLWSKEDDRKLLDACAEHGLGRWVLVAEALPSRTHGQCRERWGSILNEQLGSEGGRTVSALLLAARKAGRDAEGYMNQAAGQLTRAKSELQTATVRSQKLFTSAAMRRGWLRTHTHVQLDGDSEEHGRLRDYLKVVGPAGLLARAQASASRAEDSAGAPSLETELRLKRLVIEVSSVAPKESAKVAGKETFLRVRDNETGAVCLYWEPPKDARVTDPSATRQQLDPLTKKLHEAA